MPKIIEFIYLLVVFLYWLQCIIVLIAFFRPAALSARKEKYPSSVVVIIPAYNAGETIRNTINSWYRCSPMPGKIIVIDDGSTDHTALEIKALQREIPILHVFSKSNQGKTRTLNFALTVASNEELLVFADADTMPEPDVLKHLISPFANREIVAVSANRRTDKSMPPHLRLLLDVEHVTGANLTRNIGNSWGWQIGLSGVLAAFRKSALIEVGGFPEVISEDTSITLSLQKVGITVYASKAIAYTKLHGEAHSALEQHRRWLLGAIQAVMAYVPRSASQWSNLSYGLLYFLIFRILLALVAPFADYFALYLLLTHQLSYLGIAVVMYLVPSLAIGILAILFDHYPIKSLFVLPFVQFVVRQYSIALILYITWRAITRTPINWR